MVNWAPWIILFSPLASTLLITLVTRRSAHLSRWIAFAGTAASFSCSVILALHLPAPLESLRIESTLTWLAIQGFTIEFGFLINSISLLMLLVVSGVSALIFYYSFEYMKHDSGMSRYFAYLSFFAFSMLGIVLSNNLIQLFIFWELVGVSSYLLIGFWYERSAAADAGKKAFVTNRLGDFGFLIGILLLWTLSEQNGVRTLNLLKLEEVLPALGRPKHLLTVASLLVFCGVLGKSAQFPLHVWLPDAMEGPTPVSALIHAATMVAAGVYLLARTFFLFHLSPFALDFVAYVGGFTAIFAASQALVQTDIKRVLAYSTLSQLGYMVMAAGLGGSGAAMFHLSTHAFFKALLFLAAGSVIHMTHEQDLRRLGGLAQKMPVTALSFIVGSLALAGIYPLSGFFSKEEILSLAFTQNQALFWIAAATSLLTSVYITRCTWLAFFTKPCPLAKAKDPSQWMLIPLGVLSLLSLAAGWLPLEQFVHHHLDTSIVRNRLVPVIGMGAGMLGILIGIWIYGLRPFIADSVRTRFPSAARLLSEKYYIDRFYDFILARIQKPFAEFLDAFEANIVVKTAVNGAAGMSAFLGDRLRRFQSGNIQDYVATFFGGVVVFLYFLITQGGF